MSVHSNIEEEYFEDGYMRKKFIVIDKITEIEGTKKRVYTYIQASLDTHVVQYNIVRRDSVCCNK